MNISYKSLQGKKRNQAFHTVAMPLLATVIAFTSCTLSGTQKAEAAGPAMLAVKSLKTNQKRYKKNARPDIAKTEENPSSSPLILASASGLARQLPEGLQPASQSIKVGYLKPELISMLDTIHRHFGKTVIITSGYRNPAHNKKVGGVQHSLHISGSAADIRIAGVNKWEVAKFVRSMPDRGGVGTYCSNQIVHVDIGRKRDWYWGCSGER